MLFLILSILSSTLIVLLFKLIGKNNLNLLAVIVVNYFVAVFLGLALQLQEFNFEFGNWIWLAVLIGSLFIFVFYLMGVTTQRIGVSVTVISAKMSMAIPILFSLLYFNEELGTFKIIGIILAIVSVALAAYIKSDKKADRKLLFLPLLIFVFIGIADSLIKLAQHTYIPEGNIALFSATCFAVAAILGISLLLLKRNNIQSVFKANTLVYGLALGLVNFASLYFFILALEKSNIDSSIVYGINNVGIISVSVLVALLLFREKLKWWNWIGLGLAVIAILVLV